MLVDIVILKRKERLLDLNVAIENTRLFSDKSICYCHFAYLLHGGKYYKCAFDDECMNCECNFLGDTRALLAKWV